MSIYICLTSSKLWQIHEAQFIISMFARCIINVSDLFVVLTNLKKMSALKNIGLHTQGRTILTQFRNVAASC